MTRMRVASVLLLVVVALLQASLLWRIEIAGAAPNLMILVVASLALLTGSVYGAVYGFIGGVLIALFGALPLGPHALIATLIGYTIGRIGEALITDEHPVPPLVAGVAASAIFALGRPLVEFLVNPAAHEIGDVMRITFLTTVLGAIFSIPVYVLVKRTLAAAFFFGNDSNTIVLNPTSTISGGEE